MCVCGNEAVRGDGRKAAPGLLCGSGRRQAADKQARRHTGRGAPREGALVQIVHDPVRKVDLSPLRTRLGRAASERIRE